MREARHDLDFLEEALHAERRGEARAQHLDGDLAVMLAVLRLIHARHAALTEQAVQFVALGERGLELGGNVGRHGFGI